MHRGMLGLTITTTQRSSSSVRDRVASSRLNFIDSNSCATLGTLERKEKTFDHGKSEYRGANLQFKSLDPTLIRVNPGADLSRTG